MKSFALILLVLSPILYPGLAILISLFVARRVRRKVGEAKSWKPLGTGLITFVVIMLIPTWNILIARGYMYYRCGNEGGLYVYQTVKVPVEYFDGWGNARLKYLPDSKDGPGVYCFGERCFRYIDKRTIELNIPPGSHISKFESKLQDINSGEILGRRVSFAHSTWYSMHSSAAICPSFSREEGLALNVFVPANDN